MVSKNQSMLIRSFLQYLNATTSNFVLKGGNALVQCYDLPRLSEDIYLDATKADILLYVDGYCKKLKISYRVAKNTNVVKRCLLHFSQKDKPLKIEVSYRKRDMDNQDIRKVKGLQVYSIDQLALMKSMAYMGRDRIRDLFDLSFVCDRYYKELSQRTITAIREAVGRKGIEQFDFLMETDPQSKDIADKDKLMEQFLQMFDKLGLMNEEEHALGDTYTYTPPTDEREQESTMVR